MKTKSLLIASLVAITAVLETQPVFGVPDHQLVFTENSSSSLSVTYDGSTAGITVVGGGDVWSVTFLNGIVVPGTADWKEATDPNHVNETISLFSGPWTIRSDVLVDPGTYNGAPPDGYTYVGVGTDPSDNVPFDMTFNDLGDPVPDTGTTFALLFLSFFALMGATRVAPFRQREMVRSCANGKAK